MAQNQQDRIVSTGTGEKPVKPDNLMEQPVLPKDERLVSTNPSLEAAAMGHAREIPKQLEYPNAGGDISAVHPLHVFTPHDPNFSYAGYDSSAGTWDGYPHYVNADGYHIMSPVIYNDNSSMMLHSGYGFNSDMAYGHYSPVGTPMPSMMVDGQLYPSQQIPYSPSYYPQPAPSNMPHISSGILTEMMTPESSSNDNMFFGSGSGYMLPFGSFGGNLPGNSASSSLASPSLYPQPMGVLGSYEHNIGQISYQERSFQGLVSRNSTGHYPHNSLYQNSHLGNASISYAGVNDHNRFGLDKGRRRERDSVYVSNGANDISVDRNRGPRATRVKVRSTSEQGSLSGVSGNDQSGSALHPTLYNQLDFVTDYENAKFFIIKSFSEDNIHKSIKYNVWASTPHGNKKLDAAYHQSKEMNGICPLFLLFSVNGSGQFCGVAEMVGPVNFEKDADYWHQDRWSGQFPVQWHIIKDVPNNRFRHILLENNDNKPVTHSRDSQEVKLEHGIEILRIFKDYDAHTSILDDFDFYDERERSLKDRKARQPQASSTKDVSGSRMDESITQISDSFAQSLQLEDGKILSPEAELEESGRESVSANMGTGSQK